MTENPSGLTLQRDAGAPGVALLRLDRPERRNALDTTTLTALLGVLADLAADPTLRVLVLSSTDIRALSAGADVAEELDAAGGVHRMELFTHLYTAIDAFPVPTVAVCVGSCVGAGAEIAVGCDLRVGGDNLKLAWAGARLGVPIGPGRLVPLVGVARAKDLLFTGRPVGQAEAERLGLVTRTAAAGDAEAAALGLAAELTAQSAEGLRGLKQMFRDLEGSPARIAHENERLMQFQRTGGGLPRGGLLRR